MQSIIRQYCQLANMRPKTAKIETSRLESRQTLEKEQGKCSTAGKSRVEKRAANITFTPQLSYLSFNALITQHMHLIRQHKWRFNFKEFKDKNVSDVLADARILLIHSLTLHFCKQSSILKEMSLIGFPKMTVLNLTGNKIASLEPLQRMYLPTLESLFLRENLLTSLRSLRKCNFHLKSLQISENQIISLDGLEQLDLASLAELWGYKNPIILNWNLLKLQIKYPTMKRIHLYQTQTIDPLRLFRALNIYEVRDIRI